GDFAYWHRFAEGLANGTDPPHPEYWGTVNGRDQRMVELASLGFALALVPEKICEPLDARSRGNAVADIKAFEFLKILPRQAAVEIRAET
ncbi:DUF2264 domain-containing protein, partial [Rhizobium ruizarguesonis]